MTREDIIRMAREVGFVAYGEDAGEYRIPTPAFHDRLQRFAALFRAQDRKELEQELLALRQVVGGPRQYVQGRWDVIGEFQDILRAGVKNDQR